jgi:hypothetical protein
MVAKWRVWLIWLCSGLQTQNATDMYYKLSNRFYINQIVLLIFLTIFFTLSVAQKSSYTRAVITGKYDDFQMQVVKD